MLKDLINEITVFLKGKTVDSLVPPLIFVSLNAFFNLTIAIVLSITFSLFIILYRWLHKENIKYALIGFVMLAFASLLAILTNNPNSYFLPDLITNIILVVLSLVLLILNKPLAAYASHLTRAWPLAWYWRKDIKPAYFEVSLFWLIFFLFKSIIQVIMLFYVESTFLNLLIGLPFTLLIMSLSYIYGILRLKQLKGPSVEEFIQDKPKPYKGQTKGF